MKLSAILILVTALHISTRSVAQKVTYSGRAMELPTIFSSIHEQTGYVFFYDKKDLQGTHPVSVLLDEVSLDQALKIIFEGQPLDFEVQGNTVFVTRKDPPPQEAPLPEKGKTIRGRISDDLGIPLEDASVMVRGTKQGARTNAKGEFELKRPSPGGVLIISYTGYVTQEFVVRATGMSIITMKRNQNILDATIIQGYGITSRRFSVGSITSIDAATIGKQPVSNVLLALEGQAPGLVLNATSGVPGSRVQLQVRGQNSIAADPTNFRPYDQPLFIVDGIPFAPQNNNTSQLDNIALGRDFSGGIDQAIGLSPFNAINPADIESISVLKDADATSIYGTQGSNGVILITTRKGKPGKTVFNFTASTGFNTAATTLKLMNTREYLQYRKDAFAADGVTPSPIAGGPGYAPDLTIFDQDKYTNWEHMIFGKTSSNTDIYGSVSGGTQHNTFFASGGYTRSVYNYPGSGFADQRLTFHSNFHHISTDNRLTLDFGNDFGYDQNNSPGFGGVQDILLPPNLPDLLDAGGNLVWNYKGADLSYYQFYATLKRHVLLQNYNSNNTFRVTYSVLPGLSISVNTGYSRNTSTEYSEAPASSLEPPNASASASAVFAHNNFQTFIVEPQADYNCLLGKGIFSALLGGTYKENNAYSSNIEGVGYANDDFLNSIDGAATVYAFDASNIYMYSAGFARIKYIYDQRYILSLTGRRDGSSNFGPGHQFGNFGSVGAGWIFSEEKAFKEALPFISYAKIAGNYGTSGSDGIASYQYQALWSAVTYIPPFQGIRPTVPTNVYNPNYSWALKKSLNASLDLGFFHDRLLINATYYRDREGNQLGGYPLAAQVGLPTVLRNLPATVQNSGWELSLNFANIKTKEFSWNTTFNISFNRNKLLSFPYLAASFYNYQYVIGEPTSVITGYRFKDVNPTTGLFEYYDRNGKTTSSPNYGLAANGGDEVPIGNREVKYMGGFGNTFTYKHFSLYVFFQFSSQIAPNWLSTVYNSYTPNVTIGNLPVQALDYWKKPGDRAALQKLSVEPFSATTNAGSIFGLSTGVYSDDTYLRLKTMSFSYSLPDALFRNVHIHDCRVFANAQNLLTFTNYKAGDPELFTFVSFPLQRIVAFGLNFNFQ